MRQLTGARTKLAWVQDRGDGTDVFLRGNALALMVLDTDDGRGERTLVGRQGNYVKPLISPSGRRVVYSTRDTGEVFAVDWDGGEPSRLGAGFALDVWRDPQSGDEWVYVGEGDPRADDPAYAPIRRLRLDRPGQQEDVWRGPPISENHFQLSRDGRRAGGQFPWPVCGIADLASQRWYRTGEGCWTSLAPDDSYRMWIFDGAHRNFTIVDGDRRWTVRANGGEAMRGFEVYHPRWSNDVHVLTVTGPYRVGDGDARVRGGGTDVEVFVGRFDDDLRDITWVQATSNDGADFFPDVWVEPAPTPPGGDASRAPAVAARTPAWRDERPGGADAWPVARDALLYLWDNKAATNEVPGREGNVAWRTEPRDAARYGRFLEMQPAGGYFDAVAPSGVRLPAVESTGFSLEIVLTADGPQRGRAVTIVDRTGFVAGLEQRDDAIWWATGAGGGEAAEGVRLATLPRARASHLVVSIRDGRLTAAQDGRPVVSGRAIPWPGLSWPLRALRFGGGPGDEPRWRGGIEAVALRASPLEDAVVRRSAEALATRLAGRAPLPRLVVEAVALEVAPLPSPQSILPYRRALAVNRYRVGRVIEGRLDAETVAAAHWVILDGRSVPEAARQVGGRYRLVLEAFDAHPELEGERLALPPGDVPIDLYYVLQQ